MNAAAWRAACGRAAYARTAPEVQDPLAMRRRPAASCVQQAMTDTSPALAPRSQPLKIWLIVATLAAIVTVPLSLFWAGMSAMSSTTTTDAGWVELYVIVNLAIPALNVVGIIGGWIAWSMRRTLLGWLLLFSPLAPFVISLAMMAAWPSS